MCVMQKDKIKKLSGNWQSLRKRTNRKTMRQICFDWPKTIKGKKSRDMIQDYSNNHMKWQIITAEHMMMMRSRRRRININN